MAETYLTTTKAREMLGISRGKMTDMIRRGEIATYPDPLDRRVRLIRRADVEALLTQRGIVEEKDWAAA